MTAALPGPMSAVTAWAKSSSDAAICASPVRPPVAAKWPPLPTPAGHRSVLSAPLRRFRPLFRAEGGPCFSAIALGDHDAGFEPEVRHAGLLEVLDCTCGILIIGK